ncbi:Cytochrome P450 CYP2 subfamily [Handroanthus impetiginosus]|uniref:Cytochrome P450 CYP2 subfamily n=1 Tax=Handroanthus impetiginosus TaxID=429701 RepID=A0A2G9H1Z3_9LAMI|nr:Cytochrome P450 CYP2 subfamily [Handroanthus impetiginosus]
MLLLLLLLTLPIVFIHLLRKTKSAKALNPPGPPRLPLIGNLHQIYSCKNLHEFLWQLSKKYGPIMYLKLGSMPLVVVSSVKLAKEVLKTQDHLFCNRPNFVGLQKLSYNNSDIAFSPYSDSWRELRKILTVHLLSPKKVQSFRPIREDEMSRLVARIKGVALSSQVVNLNEIMTSFTSTLICRVAFGKRYDEEGSDKRRFDELICEAEAMMAGFFMSDCFPGFGWMDKISGMTSRLEKNFKEFDEFYAEIIEEHLDPDRKKKIKMKDEDDTDDVLDVLIKLKEEKTCSIDLNWNTVKALLMNIFLAGSDTNAAAIIWTMTLLMKAPNVMKKVQIEIRELIGRKGTVDEDDLQKLPYLNAVINETFRLWPPSPLLVRSAVEKCTLDGYEIQQETLVYINAWATARDPDHWKNPDEFLPERFLHENIDVRGQDFGVLPFGSGRRICAGILMGLAIVGLTVASMLYHFDWELPQGMKPEDIDMDVMLGLAPHKKNALCLVPKKYI